MMSKNWIRSFIRKVIRAKQKETIRDCVDRRFCKVEKLFYRKAFSDREILKTLQGLGIGTGDKLLVQCSWRRFYNYDGSPADIVRLLQQLVGPTGIIAMPCYGADKLFLDVDNTPSAAGVLSEVFRKTDGVKRSQSTHFSICMSGMGVHDVLKTTEKSHYGFDLNSACYRISMLDSAKNLFLGLGKNPYKVSLFHCAGYLLRGHDDFINEVLGKEYVSKLMVDGCEHEKRMIGRTVGHGNHNQNFKKIAKSLSSRRHSKVSNLDCVIFDSQECIQQALQYAQRGIYCYH